MSEERVQKVLAAAGIASRRKAEELITAGRVRVNGVRVALGAKVGPEDHVEVDGRPVLRPERHVTYLLHKPRGVLSTVSDDRGRPTVMGLVPKADGLHPVGRLDLDSEGLLLLSTDGELTLRLTHPRFGHEKEYRLWCVEGGVSDEALRRLREGVELEDGPAKVLKASRTPGGCRLVLAEGRKRQVRRMLHAVGYQVERLQRTRVGSLSLGNLPAGGWRELTARELDELLG